MRLRAASFILLFDAVERFEISTSARSLQLVARSPHSCIPNTRNRFPLENLR
jgi:hypothetical protein